MSDDDRANRLRQRRNKAKDRAGEGETEPSKPSQLSEPSEQSETDETDETDEQSVKDEHEGVYIYLPEQQKKEVGYVYNAAKSTYEREHEDAFEKNRHYYPLVVEYGLERVDEADADELAEMLNELDY